MISFFPKIFPSQSASSVGPEETKWGFWSLAFEKVQRVASSVFAFLQKILFLAESEEARIQNRLYFLEKCFPRKALFFEMLEEAERLYPTDVEKIYRLIGRGIYQKRWFFQNVWRNIFWFFNSSSYIQMGKEGIFKELSEEMFLSLKTFYQERLSFLQTGKMSWRAFGRPEMECLLLNTLLYGAIIYGYQRLGLERIKCSFLCKKL
jgi:hypothetical protein